MSRQFISTTMPDVIAGVAWLIERDHPHLSRAQLAKAARRQLARERLYTRAAGVCRSDDEASRAVAECPVDGSAVTLADVIRREGVARCLDTCRRIDSRVTDAMLDSLADGISRDGDDGSAVSCRTVAEIAGVCFKTVSNRLRTMRAKCLAR